MRVWVGLCVVSWLSLSNVCAQIGAEAQGGQLTSWFALGIEKEITKKWESATDVGYGRHSDPNNYSFLKRDGLFILTQDFIYSFHAHWKLTNGLGYWKRYFYTDDAPYNEQAKPYQFRNEIRPYEKITYHHRWNKIRITHTLRTDFRFYFNQQLSGSWPTAFEFRLRLLENWKIPIT